MSPTRTTLVAGVTFAAVALGGLLAGVAVDRTLLRRPPPPPREGPPGGFGMGPRGLGPQRDSSRVLALAGPPHVRRFAQEALGLDSAQVARTDSIARAQSARLQALAERMRPAVDSVVAETRAALDRVLTDAQRARLRTLALPRPERGPPTGGPPPGIPMGGPPMREPPGGPPR